MNEFDTFLRSNVEQLQYAVFFGALAGFGVLELWSGRSRAKSERLRRWPTNFGLTALNIMLLGVLPVSGVLVADHGRAAGIGLLNAVEIAPAATVAIGLLIRSLISWAVHLAMHKLPVLWRIHRVHHTDTVLDVSTTVRFHPLELVLSTPVVIAATVAMGLPPIALMLYELFDAAMAVFTHASIRLPACLDRALRLLLVTPDMHRVHHSSRQFETDSNYGATLSIWDRLFGTYRGYAPVALELGLSQYRDRRTLSLGWLLALPFLGSRAVPMAPDRKRLYCDFPRHPPSRNRYDQCARQRPVASESGSGIADIGRL